MLAALWKMAKEMSRVLVETGWRSGEKTEEPCKCMCKGWMEGQMDGYEEKAAGLRWGAQDRAGLGGPSQLQVGTARPEQEMPGMLARLSWRQNIMGR